MIDVRFFLLDDKQPAENAGDAAGPFPSTFVLLLCLLMRPFFVGDTMDLDTPQQPSGDSSKPISTHGPRGSRREQWRLSKGLSAKPERKGVNRQGGFPARRKAGRSHRRR